MKLYCCRKTYCDEEVKLLEIEVTEKPKSYTVTNEERNKNGITRNIIKKSELGIINDWGEIYGTTKVQALSGFVSAKSRELASYESECQKLREEIAQANSLNK